MLFRSTLLENFELFLKGNGFVLKGNIDVVEDFVDDLYYIDKDKPNVDYDITAGTVGPHIG